MLTLKCSRHKCGTKARKKLDVARLQLAGIQRQLENKMDEPCERHNVMFQYASCSCNLTVLYYILCIHVYNNMK